MITVDLGPGLAPDVWVTAGSVYVAYGQQTPSALVVVQLDNAGHILTSHTLPDGFFNSFPRFGGPWMAYKTGAPNYGPALVNVQTGQTVSWPGVAAGNYPIVVNEALQLTAFQNGQYPIFMGDLAGSSFDSGLQGAPDGLDTLISSTDVTLRKDTRQSVPGMYYPVTSQDLTVGEWFTAPYGIGVQLTGDVLRVAFNGQDCPTPRCSTDGTTYALVTGGPSGVRVWIGSRAELQALPTAASLIPPPVFVPGPTTPPRAADGRLYDTAPFYVSDTALQPRSGPTHPQCQVQDDGDLLYWVKFGNPQAYESRAFDGSWIYFLEDASGDVYHFSDPRWHPREMAIGEGHAFINGPHEAIYTNRSGCAVTNTVPYNRKAWMLALYDGYDWGPDLGVRPTIRMVYDPTAGIYSSTRFIEVNDFASGAGWCRWEAHRSDLVYASGSAVFDDTTRTARSDFYLVGGAMLQPELTGCVPQAVPIPPPIPTPDQGSLMQIFVTVDPTKVIAAKAIQPAAGYPGCFNYILEDGSVFSANGDTRPIANAGPWEAGEPSGGIVTFWASGVPHSYGFVMTDKLPK